MWACPLVARTDGLGQTGTPPVAHWFILGAGAPPSNLAPLQSATFFGWRGFPPFVVGWLLAAPPFAGDAHDFVLAPPFFTGHAPPPKHGVLVSGATANPIFSFPLLRSRLGCPSGAAF